jgi:hypothetical protein
MHLRNSNSRFQWFGEKLKRWHYSSAEQERQRWMASHATWSPGRKAP